MAPSDEPDGGQVDALLGRRARRLLRRPVGARVQRGGAARGAAHRGAHPAPRACAAAGAAAAAAGRGVGGFEHAFRKKKQRKKHLSTRSKDLKMTADFFVHIGYKK